jgi:superfamily II DNA or RNA helicase
LHAGEDFLANNGTLLSAAEARLEALERERAELLESIKRLRAQQAATPVPANVSAAPAASFSIVSPRAFSRAPVSRDSSASEKITLFARLFRGRMDVYARRWENRRLDRSGFQPACTNEWTAGLCDKRRTKCSACPNRELLPLTPAVIRDHLRGEQEGARDREFVVGIYPLLTDETCYFLALDFDGASWQEDAKAVLGACREQEVSAALERSRSGNGAHLWLFFSGPVPAALARKLGALLLTRAMESRPEIGLSSYDRLFPSQDTMPQGGFGNLIALPLQRRAREHANTVFLDEAFLPHKDQFGYLSSLELLPGERIETMVAEAEARDQVLGARIVPEEEWPDEPWRRSQATLRTREVGRAPLLTDLPESLSVVLSNQLYLPKENLSPALRNRIIRLAAFQNPEFHRAQALHLPVFGHARVIGCAEDYPKHIALPRGCLAELKELTSELGVRLDITDERFAGQPIAVHFVGQLRPEQEKAATALLAHDTGVLSAGTAFGKTVVAAHLIAARGVNTLVLVHRQQLLEQWVARFTTFLALEPKSIGQIGAGKRKPTGVIDVALLQSLARQGQVDELVTGYGQVIVDECHHLPAGSFEQVAKAVHARYLLGLSATPTRKDGHQPILFMQCGPIRFRSDPRRQASERPFEHRVIVRQTQFALPPSPPPETAVATGPGIQQLYSLLAADQERNALIVEDVVGAVRAGRSPVVMTERREHLETLAELLRPQVANVVTLHGGMGVKRRREIAECLAAISAKEERVLVATGRYLGEGFDDARLDTLFLALPISWRGTLAQYAGRLHRLDEGKTEVIVYDYADLGVPVLARMHERRLRGYRAMGYDLN